MSSIYRSRVLVDGSVIAILPSWSDGAIVRDTARRAGRADIAVQDGEWHGHIAGHDIADAPEPTHRSFGSVLELLGLRE